MPKTSVEFFFLPPNQTNQHYTCTGSWLKKGHNTGDLRVTIGNKNVNGIFSPFGLSCFHCINPRPPSANVQPLGRGGGVRSNVPLSRRHSWHPSTYCATLMRLYDYKGFTVCNIINCIIKIQPTYIIIEEIDIILKKSLYVVFFRDISGKRHSSVANVKSQLETEVIYGSRAS